MKIRESYERVTEGMALKELWGQFKTEAESSYNLYSEEVDWGSLQKIPRWKRFFKISFSPVVCQRSRPGSKQSTNLGTLGRPWADPPPRSGTG